MDTSNLTLGLAFLAGLASFLSPCVFPLVPAYVGYLGGRSTLTDEGENTNRWEVFSHGVAFVLGFSLVFILLGVVTGALSSFLFWIRPWLVKIGGIIVIIFGIHLTGLARIPFLQYDLRQQSRPDASRGYLSSILMGVFFSAGWSPCIGPVLTGILALSLQEGSPVIGGLMLTAYSAGLAIPFLIAALGTGWVMTFLQRFGKAMHYIEIAMGVVLIVIGVMLFLGTFKTLARFGSFLDIGL